MVGRCPMPMLLLRGDPDGIAREDFLDRLAQLLHAAHARNHIERLAERMGVPGCPGTGGEMNPKGSNARRLRGGDNRFGLLTFEFGSRLGLSTIEVR